MKLVVHFYYDKQWNIMNSILIRSEDKNIWERRAPIIPDHLKEVLSDLPFQAFIQPSSKRAFKDAEYIEAGAKQTDDMLAGDIILGVKEIPLRKLLDNKVYLFFSHTVKGQAANMPILKKIIAGGSTLIDYEKIVNEKNQRLIYFGYFAGDVGAIDILWLMGEYWRHKQIETPFSRVKQASRYKNLADARHHLQNIGFEIKRNGLPEALSPLIIGILGYGNVSKGAQSIFDCLPTSRIEPENLQTFIDRKAGNPNTVYISIFKEEHLVQPGNGHAFDLQEYYQHPEKYKSRFAQYLPFMNVLINATFWDKQYPRFVTWDGLKSLFQSQNSPNLQGIADITCDVNGSVECNVKITDSGAPAYLCHPATKTTSDGHLGDGIVLLAVDNLPAELPVDSSTFFSNQLKIFIPNLVQADFSKTLEESGLRPELQRAVVVYQGKLTEPYKYLNQYLDLV